MTARALQVAVMTMALTGPAFAERISNPIAVFAGLDKITGVTTTFEVPIGEQRQFGGLIVQPRCLLHAAGHGGAQDHDIR